MWGTFYESDIVLTVVGGHSHDRDRHRVPVWGRQQIPGDRMILRMTSPRKDANQQLDGEERQGVGTVQSILAVQWEAGTDPAGEVLRAGGSQATDEEMLRGSLDLELVSIMDAR